MILKSWIWTINSRFPSCAQMTYMKWKIAASGRTGTIPQEINAEYIVKYFSNYLGKYFELFRCPIKGRQHTSKK